MAITKGIVPTGTPATILTASGNIGTLSMFFCNTNGTAQTLSVYINGITTADKIYDAISIPANDTLVLNVERLALSSSDTIAAIASTTAVNYCISTVTL